MGKRAKKWKQLIASILIVTFAVTSVQWEGCVVKAQETSEKQSEQTEEEKQSTDTSERKEYQVSEENARLEENTETSTTFDIGKHKK